LRHASTIHRILKPGTFELALLTY